MKCGVVGSTQAASRLGPSLGDLVCCESRMNHAGLIFQVVMRVTRRVVASNDFPAKGADWSRPQYKYVMKIRRPLFVIDDRENS